MRGRKQGCDLGYNGQIWQVSKACHVLFQNLPGLLNPQPIEAEGGCPGGENRSILSMLSENQAGFGPFCPVFTQVPGYLHTNCTRKGDSTLISEKGGGYLQQEKALRYHTREDTKSMVLRTVIEPPFQLFR